MTALQLEMPCRKSLRSHHRQLLFVSPGILTAVPLGSIEHSSTIVCSPGEQQLYLH